jgi:hypothetical protein
MALNLYGDLSGIAQNIQDNAIFVVRELGTMQGLVTMFTDASGGNPRVGYKYNQMTAKVVGDGDDLTSSTFGPSADQTLTPFEIAEQAFISDLRAESDAPESIIRDASLELGYAGLDKVESDLVSDMASLTGGTVGAAGSVITWGYVSAAIAQARNANKSANKPLSAVIHGFQAAVLAKTASVAGATSIAQAPGFTEQVTREGLKKVFTFMGVPIYQVFASPDSGDDFTGGVFPKEALAIDWRRAIRIRPQRDESRRGAEFNMSGVYAHGVWRPARGVKMTFDATAPTS